MPPAGFGRPDGIAAALWVLRTCARLCLVAFLSACDSGVSREALDLVLRYNHATAEAYRKGSADSVAPLVSDREFKRLDGLISARSQTGLNLDSRLLRAEVLEARRGGAEFRVRTREDWEYVDRGARTGRAIGSPMRDSYEMLYIFKRETTNWIMQEIQFATAPKIGRTNSIWSTNPPTRPMLGETNPAAL